jgi:hypothetical protein
VFVGDNGNITRKDILKRYGVAKAGFIFRLRRAATAGGRDRQRSRMRNRRQDGGRNDVPPGLLPADDPCPMNLRDRTV